MNNLCKANLGEKENRGNTVPPKHSNKFSFKKMKSNTVKSLNDVEYFLNDLNNFWKYIKLYKILK